MREGGGTVSKIVNCECGEVIQADSDDEIVQKVEDHVRDAHPELTGKMTRDDVLAMVEET
jgi:predicted small metal-binding protein